MKIRYQNIYKHNLPGKKMSPVMNRILLAFYSLINIVISDTSTYIIFFANDTSVNLHNKCALLDVGFAEYNPKI